MGDSTPPHNQKTSPSHGCPDLLTSCLLILSISSSTTTLPPTCPSPIYCHGSLLHTVQMARIFNDSKTFVDLKMRRDQDVVLKDFEAMMLSANGTPSRAEVRGFVLGHFEEGDELEEWRPRDFSPNPGFLDEIDDALVREFARKIVNRWRVLSRKVKEDVIHHPDRYSLIPLPNGIIIPGGRFRETYYWDSYWILQGLFLSDMKETARGMIENFIFMVKNYGFVPNGGRIYYLNRSQPPLLTKMAALYYKHTQNKAWLERNIKYLAKELEYWLNQKTTQVTKDGNVHTMAHYIAESSGPRPESYSEDMEASSALQTEDQRQALFTDLKSAAETGWDFSSRWVFDEAGGNLANISHLQTRRVIPVDLNSYLCGAFNDIAFLYGELKEDEASGLWAARGRRWQKSLDEVLWNEEDGIWYDYDGGLGKHRRYYYPSNVAPLWSGCFSSDRGPALGQKVGTYLQRVGALDNPGGIPVSILQTGEQWDFPNAWPPMVDMVVTGLQQSGDAWAMSLAKEEALKWIRANLKGFEETDEMFEKYDALLSGKYGGGGEYRVQTGFGWTNGVVLQFISQYARRTGDNSNGKLAK